MANKIIDRLKPAHKAFVYAYVANGFNALQAYLKVKPHVSIETARSEGSQWAMKPDVKAAVNECLDVGFVQRIASRQYLIQQAHDVGEEARSKGQYNPALTSIDLKAKLSKLYDRDTPDIETYNQVINQFYAPIQVNIDTTSPTEDTTSDIKELSPQDIDITPDNDSP